MKKYMHKSFFNLPGQFLYSFAFYIHLFHFIIHCKVEYPQLRIYLQTSYIVWQYFSDLRANIYVSATQ